MKIISCINMKGGVAKTTIAVNIAHCLATRNKVKILLIDVDPQFNATQCLMSPEVYVEYVKKGKDTIKTIFERDNQLQVSMVNGANIANSKDLRDIKPVTITENFDLIPGSLELFRMEMSSGNGVEFKLKNYLNINNDKYDYVIIDTPPTPSAWMTSALLASDYYLIPVKTDPLSLTGIDLLYSVVNEKVNNYGMSIKCCGVVLTMVEINTISFSNAKEFLNKDKRWTGKTFSSYLSKRTDIANNQTKQKMILDLNDPDVKSQIVAITNELIERTK